MKPGQDLGDHPMCMSFTFPDHTSAQASQSGIHLERPTCERLTKCTSWVSRVSAISEATSDSSAGLCLPLLSVIHLAPSTWPGVPQRHRTVLYWRRRLVRVMSFRRSWSGDILSCQETWSSSGPLDFMCSRVRRAVGYTCVTRGTQQGSRGWQTGEI